jgi:hypothetical protein
MAITAAIDGQFNTENTIQSFIARGGAMEFGVITFDSSMPSTGESLTFNMRKVVSVNINPYDGYVFEYDRVNSKVFAYKQSSNVNGALAAFSGDLSSLSNVPYDAWGWK